VGILPVTNTGAIDDRCVEPALHDNGTPFNRDDQVAASVPMINADRGHARTR